MRVGPGLRVAIVHDYLTQRGGAERVVLQLAELLPGAPIITSLYEPTATYPEFAALEVRTTWLQGRVDAEHFRRAALLYPRAFARIDLSDFDVVVVSSSAFAHHVRHPAAYVYCHTPPRFLYQAGSYTDGTLSTRALAAALNPLRAGDRRAARRSLAYAANSATTAQRIRKDYGIDATLIHPAISLGHLPAEPVPLPARPRALVISRLLPYKRVDVAIAACARLGVPLTVIGRGPDGGRLRSLAGPDVEFRDRVTDDELRRAFSDHSVVLVPGTEDFGLVPVEANYAGRPVVAAAAGGALETVRDGACGRLVEGADHGRWASALDEVLGSSWSPDELRRTTEPFQPSAFRRAVSHWLPAGLVSPDGPATP